MKILLVTFPNDLGSRTIEENLSLFLSTKFDVRVFRFAAKEADRIDCRVNNLKSLLDRFQDAQALRLAVRAGVKEGRKVLFYNITTALFSYGCWRGGEVYITMDWMRRLTESQQNKPYGLVSRIHRQVLKSCAGLLPMTSAMAECLAEEYGVPTEQIHLVPSLFDVEALDPSEITPSQERIRLLFVGGDIIRKGGDLLYERFRDSLSNTCDLTMVTHHPFEPLSGMKLLNSVRYGTDQHRKIMQSHDILVLPTRQDSGPQVIGEAAAAGLAVFTTRFALGAPHVVRDKFNGCIANSPEQCLDRLAEIVNQPDIVTEMRRNSLMHMREHYSRKAIVSAYASAMNLDLD